MDKLGLVGSSLIPTPKKRSEKKKVEKEKAVSFRSRLRETGEDASLAASGISGGLTGTETAEELLDDVYQLGELLKKDGSLGTLKKYRDSVKRFYKFVVSNSLEAEKINGRLNPRTMSRKQYTLIAVVDKQLERLGACVLQNQKDQLEILKKVDEIYGILVDLTR